MPGKVIDLKIIGWISLIVLLIASQAASFPIAEFTSDDGTWILDAWLRLKEHDWFTLWVTTSQGVKNAPLVSWLFALPLKLWPSVTSVQLLILIFQVATLLLIRKIGQALRFRDEGLVAGGLFVFLPSLCLNYSQKLCNPSLIVFASALVFWARHCNRGFRRWLYVGLAMAFAVQVHYAFVIYAIPLAIDAAGLAEKYPSGRKFRMGMACAALALLVLSCFLPGMFPHLRSMVDLVVPSSNYMLERSAPYDPASSSRFVLPFELIPCLLGLVFTARSKLRSTPRIGIWHFLVTSIGLLAIVAVYSSWSPHPWMLPWVLPTLLMTEIGLEQSSTFGYRWMPRLLTFMIILSTIGQSGYLHHEIATAGGTGWHYPSLSTRRDVLKLISEREPRARIVLATPGTAWTYSVVGWSALCSLPEEFLGKVAMAQSGETVILEEMGVPNWNPKFQEAAQSFGASEIGKVGSVRLWKTASALQGVWPTVVPVTARLRPSGN